MIVRHNLLYYLVQYLEILYSSWHVFILTKKVILEVVSLRKLKELFGVSSFNCNSILILFCSLLKVMMRH